MSLIIVQATDTREVRDGVGAFYASAERPPSSGLVAEALRHLIAWEDGYEPEPSAPLRLRISPPSAGWVAIVIPAPMTFDLPLAAWLSQRLHTRAVAVFTWGDGYAYLELSAAAIIKSESHIRDERSDMHLRQALRDSGIPFNGDEDRFGGQPSDWLELPIPPRTWTPLYPPGYGRRS